MEVEFRVAGPRDLPGIVALVEQARGFLAAQGLDQWQNGYPGAEVLAEDVAAGRAHVLCAGGKPLATAALCFGVEEDYNIIREGGWGAEGPYASIHRVAVGAACRGTGLAGRLMAELDALARKAGVASVRIDTHPGNLPMQRMLAKCGYTRRGVITLGPGAGGEAGDARLAFDKLL